MTKSEIILNSNEQVTSLTGFHDLDIMLKNIEKPNFILVAARPPMGKTSFMLSIMLNLLQANKKCLFFNLEMTERELQKLLLAQVGEIESNSILEHPELMQGNHIKEFLDTISKYNLIIDNTMGISIEKIKEKIETEKLEYVFIDYLQLIQSTVEKSRVESLTEILTKLKQIAKENNCVIFLTSQLDRTCETRENKRPILSDLSGNNINSDLLDVILFVYRDSYYKKIDNENDEAEIIVAKNKMGTTGTIKLIFKKSIMKFYNTTKQ